MSTQSAQWSSSISSPPSSRQKCISPINEVQPKDWGLCNNGIFLFKFWSQRLGCSWIDKVSSLHKNHSILLSHSNAAADSLASRLLGVPLCRSLSRRPRFVDADWSHHIKLAGRQGYLGMASHTFVVLVFGKRHLKVPQLLTFPEVIFDGKSSICVKC